MDGVQLSHGYRATTRRQSTFYHSVKRVTWYSLNRPQKNERLSWPWSPPAVLNPRLMDRASSVLTTSPLLQLSKLKRINVFRAEQIFFQQPSRTNIYMKHQRVRTYVLISQFSTNIFAADFRLFLKNCYSYFRVTFSKNPLVAAIFYAVAKVGDCGSLCTSLAWLLRDNSDGCWWNSNRTYIYIYVVGCLNACTVVTRRVQRGRIYTSLARKGLIINFYPPWNYHKTDDFLRISGGIEVH